MKIIDRYLYQLGKNLPNKNRADILEEIKSHLNDTLEECTNGTPSEEDAVALLKEFGSPQKVAASYNSGRQYLIGPELFPLFRMVAGIVVAAVFGAQLLALGIMLWTGEETVRLGLTMVDILASIPAAFGWVVVTFMILQHFGVQPKLDEEVWDPRTLPAVENQEEIKRGESIFGIAAGTVLLAVLFFLPDKIGFFTFPGGNFYPNPVISEFFGLICLSLLAGLGLEVYQLWKGRWTTLMRALNIGVNALSIAVLALLFKAHTAWLAAHGSAGFLVSVENLAVDLDSSVQLIGMHAFRMAFGVALIVVSVETMVLLVKMIRNALESREKPDFLSSKS